MDVEELIVEAVVVAVPLAVRFRGLDVRETMLLRGPAGWGEFAAFTEYDDEVAAPWFAAALEAACDGFPAPLRQRVPVNATVPAVPAGAVPDVLARFPGASTAKVKVAEPGQTLADDVARVEAVRELVPNVRVDANGGWTVDAAERALRALGPLQYAEQPCASVPELVELRRRLDGAVAIAADESIRRAADPHLVVRAGGADVAVLKVAPLGGVRSVLAIAERLPVPVVISSALESAVGMDAGIAAAAALPNEPLACGLGTGGLFVDDVAVRAWDPAGLAVGRTTPDPDATARFAASPERRRWWQARARRCAALLAASR